MNAQRHGTNLKTHIRIALLSLGRDYEGAGKGMKIAELEAYLKELRAEQRAVGGILKEGV